MNPDELRKTYNKIAKDYVDDHYGDSWDDDFIELFVKKLGKGAKVLDLGCGPGHETVKLTEFGLKAEGLDLSDDLLKAAKERAPDIKFTQGDMRKLPYADSNFDGVFAKASLLHIPKEEVPEVIDEIFRVLKQDGIVHVAIKGGEGEGDITENDYGYNYTRFFSYWKMEDFTETLEKHGFKVTDQSIWRRTPESFTTWLRIVAKKS